MPLEKQIVAIPFRQGPDTRSDPKQLQVGKLTLLENGVFDSPGRIKKRPGSAVLGGTGAFGTSYEKLGIYAHNDEVLTTDGEYIRTRDAEGNDWNDIPSLQRLVSANAELTSRSAPHLEVTRTARARGNYTIRGADCAVHRTTGCTAYVWIVDDEHYPGSVGVDQDNVHLVVMDETTGAIIKRDTIVSEDDANYERMQPKVIATDGYFIVTWVRRRAGVASELRHVYVDATTHTISAIATLVTLNTDNPCYDCCVYYDGGSALWSSGGNPIYPSDTRVFFVHSMVDAAGPTPRLGCFYLDEGGVTPTLSGAATLNTTDTITCCAIGLRSWTASSGLITEVSLGLMFSKIAPTNGTWGCHWNSIAGTFGSQTNVGLAGISVTYANRVDPATGVKGADLAAVTINATSLTANDSYVRYGTGSGANNAPTLDGTLGQLRGVGLAGKPFWYQHPQTDERKLFWVLGYGSGNSTQDTVFVASEDGEIVGRALSTEAYQEQYDTGASWTTPHLPQSSPVWTGSDSAVVYSYRSMQRIRSTGTTGLLIGADSLDLTLDPHTWAPPRASMAGNLFLADGMLLAYDGELLTEHGFHLYPRIVSASAGGGAASYAYKAVYEWTDATGRIHQSEPSAAVVTVNIAVITGGAPCTVVVQAPRITSKETLVDKVRVAIYRTSNGGSVYRFVGYADFTSTDYTVDTVTLSDDETDAALADNVLLYTEGGALPNNPPPPCSLVCSHRGRLWVNDTTDPTVLWYSRPLVAGAPVEFSSLMTLDVDDDGGDITGIVSFDEKLVVFKRDRVYYVTGNGPDATGAGSDYALFQLVDDVGCTNPRSIVSTPAGIAFLSTRGLYLIDRSLNATYIGADVESYVDAATITAAVLLPDAHRVCWTTTSAAGVVLAYDYLAGQWSVFTGAELRAYDATLDSDGVWTRAFGGGSGVVVQEAAAAFDDAGTAYALKVTTGWIGFAAVQGFGRLYRVQVLGDYASAHDLTLEIAYDYNTTTAETATVAASATAPYQWQFQPARQKCEAVRLTIYDNAAAEGMDLSALSLVVGVKRGLNKMASTRSMT